MSTLGKCTVNSRILAKVIFVQKTGNNQYKGNLYTLKIECPHCHSIIEYRNMHQNGSGFFKLGCRECNQRFDLPSSVFIPAYELITNFPSRNRDNITNIIDTLNTQRATETGFISLQKYDQFLINCINNTASGLEDYIVSRFKNWFSPYRIRQLFSRANTILSLLSNIPHYIYLDTEESLHIAHIYRPKTSDYFLGFIVADELLEIVSLELFSPYVVFIRSQLGTVNNAIVFTVSGQKLYDNQPNCIVNDYIDKFINISPLLKIKNSLSGDKVILYVNYANNFNLKFSGVAEYIRKHSNSSFKTVLLIDKGTTDHSFDCVISEPFFYLWPLVFQMINPDVIHLNIGEGIHGFPFIPFLINIDINKTVIDFYDIISFMSDSNLLMHGCNPNILRPAEKYLVSNFRHIIHKCSEEATTKLKQKYSIESNIVSVIEYVKEPLYTSPVNNANTINLVFGGTILAPSVDYYCKLFLQMCKNYSNDNLRLYLYHASFQYADQGINTLKQLLAIHNLPNVYFCNSLEEEDFIKKISVCDYGLTFYHPTALSERETCGYTFSYKFIAYLRAGLPIIIDEYSTFAASLIKKYNIGIVLKDEDYARLPEILKKQDLALLKTNVLKFRDNFHIKLGAAKIINMYNNILTTHLPTNTI